MNYRYYPRIEQALRVSLWLGGEWSGFCATENMSLEGMFVRDISLRRQELADLRCNRQVKVCVRCHGDWNCMSAIVVHSSEDGVGLMLVQASPEYLEWVTSLVDQQSKYEDHNLPALIG